MGTKKLTKNQAKTLCKIPTVGSHTFDHESSSVTLSDGFSFKVHFGTYRSLIKRGYLEKIADGDMMGGTYVRLM